MNILLAVWYPSPLLKYVFFERSFIDNLAQMEPFKNFKYLQRNKIYGSSSEGAFTVHFFKETSQPRIRSM
jgi:hypothetical protein